MFNIRNFLGCNRAKASSTKPPKATEVAKLDESESDQYSAKGESEMSDIDSDSITPA